MLKLPVVIGFDQEKLIGEISLDETKLPKLPSYHFALGFIINSADIGEDGKLNITSADIVQVSLVDDSKFKSFYET